MKHKEIIIIKEAGDRVDKILSENFPDYSRNYFAKLIKLKLATVNDQPIRSSYILKVNDTIEINFLDQENDQLEPASNIPLKIIYEDKDVIVVNKDPGIVVHPAAGHAQDTLVNALLQYYPQISDAVYDKDSEISVLRPGIVHRLDKDTSGVIIVAKNRRAMHSLSRQIQNRTISKKYLALCLGWPKNQENTLINHLGRSPKNRKLIADIGQEKGKEAISNYQVKKQYLTKSNKKISLIEFDIKTGRTHQIRVQASMIGHPVLGDQFYGNKTSEELSQKLGINRQMLHAYELKITLPGNNKATPFTAELPEDFEAVLKQLASWPADQLASLQAE